MARAAQPGSQPSARSVRPLVRSAGLAIAVTLAGSTLACLTPDDLAQFDSCGSRTYTYGSLSDPSETTVEADPGPWNTLMDEGRAYARAGNLSRAQSSLLSARQIAQSCSPPHFFEAHSLTALGDLYQQFGLTQESGASYREAADLFERVPRPFSSLVFAPSGL